MSLQRVLVDKVVVLSFVSVILTFVLFHDIGVTTPRFAFFASLRHLRNFGCFLVGLVWLVERIFGDFVGRFLTSLDIWVFCCLLLLKLSFAL